MIPRIIHYCWFGGNPMPVDVKTYINSWEKYCPDYEIQEWNESNFDVSENNYCREAYESKKWAFVSDYVRLKVLYEYGGFYMDTDVEVVKSLNPLRIYDAVSGYESKTHIQTGTLGACRNNEWIGMLLKDYDGRHFIRKDGSLDLKTNVQSITKLTLKRYRTKLLGQKVTFGKNMVILPFDYLCAKHWDTGVIDRTSNTFTIHHFKGSWVTDEMKRYNNLLDKYYKKYTKMGIPANIAFYLCRIKATYEMYGMHDVIRKIGHKI